MDQEGKVANGERGRRLRRWHGYAAAWTVALIVWSVGAAAPDMHSDENLLPSPMFDFSLILTLVLLFLPALLVAVAEEMVFRRSGRASEGWVLLLCGFGFLAGALAIAATRMLSTSISPTGSPSIRSRGWEALWAWGSDWCRSWAWPRSSTRRTHGTTVVRTSPEENRDQTRLPSSGPARASALRASV